MTERRKVKIVDMLQKHRQNFSKPVLLSSGNYAWLKPVSASIILEAQMAIQPPPVPQFHNQDKDRMEDNPNDPAYLQALRDVDRQREMVGMDVLVMFGVTLCDADGNLAAIPPKSEWLDKLKYMSKRGLLDLDQYDLEDDFELEFIFKKYIAVSAMDMPLVSAASGVSEEDISEALNFTA